MNTPTEATLPEDLRLQELLILRQHFIKVFTVACDAAQRAWDAEMPVVGTWQRGEAGAAFDAHAAALREAGNAYHAALVRLKPYLYMPGLGVTMEQSQTMPGRGDTPIPGQPRGS